MVKVILPVISKYTQSSDDFSVDSLQTSERNYAPNVLLIFTCFFHGDIQYCELMLCMANDGIQVGFCCAKLVKADEINYGAQACGHFVMENKW